MTGTGRRLAALEERLQDRAEGWPPGERVAMEETIARVAAQEGISADHVRAEVQLTWADARRRGATTLEGVVRLLAADQGRDVDELLAEAERRMCGGDGPEREEQER